MLAPALNRLTQLVEDILEISRIDAGRLEMNPRPLPLNDLTESAVTNHQELAQEQKLTLEHRPTKPGPVALVDPERIMRVMDSLMENAIQFTDKADGRMWATITVADTGIGIPTDELPYILDRFFRGKKPNSAALRGTSLGLSIVREHESI